jgi:hypothetical protein
MDHDRQNLEARLKECRETLPLADQLLRAGVNIGEVLALHSVVYEKADTERIPLDAAAYKVVEDLKLYSQFCYLQRSIQQAQQQLAMLNMFTAQKRRSVLIYTLIIVILKSHALTNISSYQTTYC